MHRRLALTLVALAALPVAAQAQQPPTPPAVPLVPYFQSPGNISPIRTEPDGAPRQVLLADTSAVPLRPVKFVEGDGGCAVIVNGPPVATVGRGCRTLLAAAAVPALDDGRARIVLLYARQDDSHAGSLLVRGLDGQWRAEALPAGADPTDIATLTAGFAPPPPAPAAPAPEAPAPVTPAR